MADAPEATRDDGGAETARAPGERAVRPPTTRSELLAGAAAYAESVDLAVDLAAVDWEVSERATRRAGACLYDRRNERVTVRLTWAAFEAFGWAEFRETIRHELVHAWEFQRFGRSGHGPRFRRAAERVDAPRHCRPFTEPRVRLRCLDDDCAWSPGRHRASKAVTRPERMRCGDCRAPYEVEHVESGERWLTTEGYEEARARLGDRW